MRKNQEFYENRFRFNGKMLQDADSAVRSVLSDLAKSNRPEHDRACAFRAFKAVYGFEFPVPDMVGHTVPEGYKLIKVDAEEEKPEEVADERCDFIKANGERCKMKAKYPNGRCEHHKDA